VFLDQWSRHPSTVLGPHAFVKVAVDLIYLPAMASHLKNLATLVLVTCCHASNFGPRDGSATTSGRYVKFPVIHSTNQDVFADVWAKRGIQTIPLQNRSDVAYYAMRASLLFPCLRWHTCLTSTQ
jgi:hypothetical protein